MRTNRGNNDAQQLRTPTIMVFERYSYDVFGKPEIRNTNDEILTTSSFGNRYMFTGREYDTETGNYYYRARYYSPKLGRFLQTDPIGYWDSMNLYQYSLNNPVNWVDPYGYSLRGRFREFFTGNRGNDSYDSRDQINDVMNISLDEDFPVNATEIHHLLPIEFKEQFRRVGIKNLDDYTIKLSKDAHRLKPNGLHTGKGVENWNGAWREVFRTHKNPTREQILEQLEKMMKEFGLKCQ